jgi:hypothetical protein
MAKFSFCDTKQENDWVYTPNQGACAVSPLPPPNRVLLGMLLLCGCVIHGDAGLIPHLPGIWIIWGGRWWLIWAICWLFDVPHKIFRHSGRRLCPLTKSVGLQTPSMSFSPTCDAHKNIRWYEMRCFVFGRCGFRRPYAKCAVGQRKTGFGGAADAAEMRNRFAFAILFNPHFFIKAACNKGQTQQQ